MTRSKIISAIILLTVVSLLAVLLIPRSYDVHLFEVRVGTQYWELETGSRIGYTKVEGVGSTKKNPVIYLHGGPGGAIRDEHIEALRPLSQEGHDLYFYDQVGSGHSERLEDIKEYSVDRHREDLQDIITTIGADQVILVGHSWGAMLAINYLQDHSDRVEKVVLTGPGPILPISAKAAEVLAPDSLDLIAPQFTNKEGNDKAYNWRSRLILKWTNVFKSKLASDDEVDAFFTHLNQELSKSTDCVPTEHKPFRGGSGYYSHVMTYRSCFGVEDRKSYLKTLDTPICILRGQCDNQKWGYTNEYLDLFAKAQLHIIEGAGHDLLSNNQDEYYKLISDFLE